MCTKCLLARDSDAPMILNSVQSEAVVALYATKVLNNVIPAETAKQIYGYE